MKKTFLIFGIILFSILLFYLILFFIPRLILHRYSKELKEVINHTSTTSEQIACDMDVRIEEIRKMKKTCYDDSKGHLEFLIRNSGIRTVNRLTVNVLNSDNQIFTKEFEANMTPGQIYYLNMNYSGNLKNVKIVPEIYKNNKYLSCEDSALTFKTDELDTCE